MLSATAAITVSCVLHLRALINRYAGDVRNMGGAHSPNQITPVPNHDQITSVPNNEPDNATGQRTGYEQTITSSRILIDCCSALVNSVLFSGIVRQVSQESGE